ncbi:MAG: DUF1961 family protein [Rhodoglobus sp.]|nr:DUF1961 family protein [Rhodoglobus sp.]
MYRNPLQSLRDLDGWVAEGPFLASPAEGALEFSSSGGLDDHWVTWCPEVFGDRVRVAWDFSPTEEPGLAMVFFAAEAVDGGGIFDAGVRPRAGAYPQYHSSDIRTLHISYFRRRWADERAFHTCNLRKSPGFHLVTQGADPLPGVADSGGAFYRVELVKDRGRVEFSIDGLTLFTWSDDESTGPRARGGRVGFRQMAPLRARYRNLEIEEF